MRFAARATLMLASALLVACDALLVAPRAGYQGPPVQLSLAAASEVDADYSEVLEQVDQVRFTMRSGGAERDTVVLARLVNGELVTSVRLSGDEANASLEIVADLELETGEPLFTGRAEVQTGVVGPQVHIGITPVPASLSMTELPLIESLGGSIPLQAVAYFATGDEIWGADIEWTSDAPQILEVLPGPIAVPKANGDAQLTASMQNRTVSQGVVVRQIPWGLTGIAPTDTTIAVGESFKLRIMGTDARGHPLLPGAGIWWFQPYTGVVVLDEGTATVTALATGQREIEASYLGLPTFVSTITVVP